MTTSQSAILAARGEVKRGSCSTEPKAPLTGGGEAPDARPGFFTERVADLAGKRIVLGLTGCIACYKSAELLRRMRDAGAEVDVIMTPAATQFITPTTMQALSGKPVLIDTTDTNHVLAQDSMAHIHLARSAHAILIAPASANAMARIAQGMANDLLSTLALARGDCPLLLAPAMNKEMWAHPATQRNAAQLRADGVQLLGPAHGSQACGEVGDGRMLEPQDVLHALIASFQPKTLANRRVLITAGPTSEPIDPIRKITNRSSGKTGYAIARAAHEAGAEVVLISGPTLLPAPYGVLRIPVESGMDMHAAVMREIARADVFISVAAVADWRVADPSPHKLKKTAQAPTLRFLPNPDILAEVAARPDAPWCVGFAAETEQLIEHAQAKRLHKGVPLLVGNLAQEVMDADDTQFLLFDAQGHQALPKLPKLAAARQLIQEIAQRLPAQRLPTAA